MRSIAAYRANLRWSNSPIGSKARVTRRSCRNGSSFEVAPVRLMGLCSAFDVYVGLVRAVAFVRRLQLWAAAFVELGCVGLHPAPDATGDPPPRRVPPGV